MKSLRNCVIALAVALTLASCSQDNPVDKHPERNITAADQKTIANSNDFGYDLFKLVEKDNPGKNVFLSPLSVSFALGMTYNGASGSTREAFVNVLRLAGMDSIEVNDSYRNVSDILYSLDDKVKFSLANSIWYKQEYSFEKTFIDLNKKYFNAEVTALDFNSPDAAGIINKWVEENTGGKIKKLIESVSPEMIMYLINTIYFDAPWKYKFDKTKTIDGEFINSNGETINCKLMQNSGKFLCWRDQTVTALSLPYGNGSFRMLLLMPEGSISDYIAGLDNSDINAIDALLAERETDIVIPRFTMDFDVKLNDYLSAMGLSIAFDPNTADFYNMYKASDELYISEVKHKSYVEVDEEGTVAAAATSVGIGNTATPPTYVFNKPFVFLITDTKTNTVMFIGKLEKPL